MKQFILVIATVLLINASDARERWGPPPVCPQPKAECCPKKKCCPKPPTCTPQPCAPKSAPIPYASKPAPKQASCESDCKPVCETKCEPCCPPVCLERGNADVNCCLTSSFSEPANIELDCGANLFVTASFTYWEAIQGGMDLALPGQATTSNPLVGVQHSALGNSVLIQDFDYQPGFQVGIGWSGAPDDWVYYGEYTWFRSTTNTSAAAPTPTVGSINGVTVGPAGIWVPTSWLPFVYTLNNETTHISSKWDCDMDIADVQVSRPFYSGRRLILEPLFGLRGLWIRQALDITVPIVGADGAVAASANRTAQYRSHSWAVGPRAGVNGKWHFGYGIRMIGDASASLLYTRYTEISQNVPTPDALDIPAVLKMNDFDTLRPNLDLSIGLGWGSYFACRRFYLDLAATYDFNVFFEQNMMRYLADLTTSATVHPDGAASNLYLHGLTVKAAFEF